MTYSTPGPDRALPCSTGQTTARRNLLTHLIMIANQRLATSAFHRLDATANAPCVAFLEALHYIIQLLDPSVAPTQFDSNESAASMMSQVQKLWTEIVIGDADRKRSAAACDYAHKLLTRFPSATSYYVNECARSFSDPQLAVDLLAQASQFIRTPVEGTLISRAQAYAMQVLLRHKSLTPPPILTATSTVASAVRLTPVFPPAPTPKRVVTKSHTSAIEHLMAKAEVYFESVDNPTQLKLRLNSLIIGASGTGKSWLCETVARDLKADYYKVTRADWIVRGARPGRATVFQILDRLLACDRLLLFIDELDKCSIDYSREWSAGVGVDMLNILDRVFQIPDYLRELESRRESPPSIAAIEAKIRSCLFIVGAGAWQDVFSAQSKSGGLGFNTECQTGSAVTIEAIIKAGLISHELLMRFSGDIIWLNSPDQEETAELLISTGIAQLAQELGISITAADVNWSQGGMRQLETIATRLAIEKHRRAKKTRNGANQATITS